MPDSAHTAEAACGGLFPAQFDRFRLADFDTILVGLSGGSDSLALTLAAKAYLDEKHPGIRLVAVTVDHGLRSESAAEAAHVGQICAAHGIAHDIMRWEGAKPETGIQQKAREARYRLLAQAAQRHGTSLVLIAHNKSDDAETRTMRGQRTSGGRSRGISPATLYKGKIWFARPFLELEKPQLQHYLRTLQIDWIEDPSNHDRRFERVRVRQSGNAKGSGFLSNDDDLTGKIAALLGGTARIEIGAGGNQVVLRGAVAIDELHVETLRILLAMVGRTAYLPSHAATREALENLYQSGEGGRKFTLNGCIMTKGRSELGLRRESRNTGKSLFGYDHILPSRDYKIAQILRWRRGLDALPPLPMR